MSTLFVWNDVYKTDFSKVDSQHQTLINLMNKLHQANETRKPKPETVNLLNELAAFTVKHFADEEALMQTASYPDIEDHKKNMLLF